MAAGGHGLGLSIVREIAHIFGATVELADEDDARRSVTLVGDDEAEAGDDPAALEARMADQIARRDASQPTRDRSAGSTFRNPPGDHAARLIEQAARKYDSGERCDLEAGMAKLIAARVAWAAADNALQIHGGNGFALEYRISRILCDARILNIFEGAAEIQAQVIARRLLE